MPDYQCVGECVFHCDTVNVNVSMWFMCECVNNASKCMEWVDVCVYICVTL